MLLRCAARDTLCESPSEKNNLARGGGANGQWRSGDEEVTERKTLKPLPVDASAAAATAAGALHFAPSRVTLPMMTAVVRSLCRSPGGGVVLYVDNVCALLAALIGDKDLPSTVAQRTKVACPLDAMA